MITSTIILDVAVFLMQFVYYTYNLNKQSLMLKESEFKNGN